MSTQQISSSSSRPNNTYNVAERDKITSDPSVRHIQQKSVEARAVASPSTHQQSFLIQHPYLTLFTAFLVVKTFYIFLIFLIPLGKKHGKGYDTSTELLLFHGEEGGAGGLLRTLLRRLTRWDSIYFVKIASRGFYAYEQEWAFGLGWTMMIGFVGRTFSSLLAKILPDDEYIYAFSGMVVNNLGHLMGTLFVYEVGREMSMEGGRKKQEKVKEKIKGRKMEKEQKRRLLLPIVAGLLYVINPAGIFLVAPYSEGLFACLSFGGYFVWAKWGSEDQTGESSGFMRKNFALLLSGLLFGLSTMVRTNGILNGLLFFHEFIKISIHFVRLVVFAKSGKLSSPPLPAPSQAKLIMIRIIFLVISGILVLIGFIFPQYLAYTVYCHSEDKRPWCSSRFPSIYTFVQSRYWNVGFLRYWAVSNIPLFFFAAPMITILISTAAECLLPSNSGSDSNYDNMVYPLYDDRIKSIMIPQLVLAVMAITNYHVQIISRVGGSGCLGWCLVGARWLVSRRDEKQNHGEWKGRWLVRWMVVYAMLQAVLFVGFLPPA